MAWERGKDTDSDDDDDDEEVADDIEWDNLENEDALTGVSSSMQASGPFPFHGGEGMSVELAEACHTIGLPQEPIEAGGSAFTPEVQAEVGGSAVAPQAPRGVGCSANVSQELPGASPST